MTKKYNYLLPLLLAICTALGMVFGAKFGGNNQGSSFKDSELRKLDQVIDIIDEHYVDTPNSQKLVEHAIQKVLDELDPYSAYIPYRDLAHVNAQLESSFDGIGIEFNIINDTLTVVSPIIGGPSEKVGILSGDKIVKVDGEPIAGIDLQTGDVRTKLMGPKGTKVEVGIKRRRQKELITFTIVRDKIPMHSVEATYMLNENTGYIKVTRFAEETTEEFEQALKKLMAEGLESLVLDLRGNPGGYLGQAVGMADVFLKKGDLIVFTEGRTKARQDYFATGTGIFQEGKLAVLIDEGSASASEIVSGAIQDLDRGVIVGRRSHGKGTVQEPRSLVDGSSLRLTVARYFTPSGRSIQRPYEDVRKHASLTDKDADSLKSDGKTYKTKNGRSVLGQGGIEPDATVADDTSYYSAYLLQTIAKGLIFQFSGEYADKNRAQLESQFPNPESFSNGFRFSGETEKAYLKYVEENGVELNAVGYAKSKGHIANYVKAYIGKALFGQNYFYEALNSNDPVIKEALRVLSSETYAELGIN